MGQVIKLGFFIAFANDSCSKEEGQDFEGKLDLSK